MKLRIKPLKPVSAAAIPPAKQKVTVVKVAQGRAIAVKPKAKPIAPEQQFEQDLLLAYRWSYYVHEKSLIPDTDYDEQEAEYLETAPADDPLRKPGSDVSEDYPPRVRALAIYLTLLFARR